MTTDQTEINIELGRLSKNYYCNRFRSLVAWLLLMILINIVLIIVVFFLYTTKSLDPNKYYTTDMQTGRVATLDPLSQAIEPQLLQQTAAQIAKQVFTINFVNYKNIFEGLRDYFTAQAWQQMNDSMADIVAKLIDGQLFINPILGAPAVENLDGEIIKGIRYYKLRVAVKLNYQSNISSTAPSAPQTLILYLTLARQLDLNKPNELVITDFKLG